jgi:hypothetical protein
MASGFDDDQAAACAGLAATRVRTASRTRNLRGFI